MDGGGGVDLAAAGQGAQLPVPLGTIVQAAVAGWHGEGGAAVAAAGLPAQLGVEGPVVGGQGNLQRAARVVGLLGGGLGRRFAAVDRRRGVQLGHRQGALVGGRHQAGGAGVAEGGEGEKGAGRTPARQGGRWRRAKARGLAGADPGNGPGFAIEGRGVEGGAQSALPHQAGIVVLAQAAVQLAGALGQAALDAGAQTEHLSLAHQEGAGGGTVLQVDPDHQGAGGGTGGGVQGRGGATEALADIGGGGQAETGAEHRGAAAINQGGLAGDQYHPLAAGAGEGIQATGDRQGYGVFVAAGKAQPPAIGPGGQVGGNSGCVHG